MSGYLPPTIGGFKLQFTRDFPFATVSTPVGGSEAQLTLTVNDAQQVVGVAIDTPGTGYSTTQPPSVIVYGGGGIGALVAITITAGAVATASVTRPGAGYSKAPLAYIGVGDNTDNKKVTDYDIAKALTAALSYNFNPGLFASQAAYTYAANLLTAHYLCETVVAGTTGLSGQAEWLHKAKSVGNVREDFEIPDRVLKSPILSKLSKTTYGAQFLELVSPQLIANFQTFHRETLP